MANRTLTLNLNLKTGGTAAVRDAVVSLTKEMQAQEQQVVRLKTALDQTFVSRRVSLQLQAEEAHKQLAFAEGRERAKQLGPGKGLLDLFGLGEGGGLGKMLSGAGGKLAGIGEAMGGQLGGLLGKAGGFLGGAAAGPIGAAVAAVVALTPAIKSLASAPFNAIVGGMGAVNKALAGLTGTLGPVGSILGHLEGVGGGLKAFGDKLGPLGIGLSVMGGFVEGLTKQVEAFLNTSVALASKAQPGRVKQLQFAVDDTAAVVGHRLVPVVELLTKVVRGIGDVLQTVLPSASEFRSALAHIGGAFDDVKEAITPLLPFIKAELTGALRLIGGQLRLFAAGLKLLLAPLTALNNLLNRMGAGVNLESSTGAAARPVSFMSSRQYAESAYAAAAGSGADPTRQTAQNTSQMLRVLQDIRDRLPGGKTTLGRVLYPSPEVGMFMIGAAGQFLRGH